MFATTTILSGGRPTIARPVDSTPAGSAAKRPPDAALDRGGELMLRWRDGGDEAAFDALVAECSEQVFALLTRFLGRSHPRREDLAQEVFIRVLRARDRYEPTARFSTWLYSIVFRMCVNETERSRSRRARSIDAWPGDDGGGSPAASLTDERTPDPAAGLEAEDAVLAVRRAIAALPEKQRAAVVLARYHDMPYSEIAVALDSSEQAIKSLIHRARETLRAELQPFMDSTGADGAGEGAA